MRFLPVIVCNSLLGPVHTDEFSFENVYISMRLDLPSITHRFENALESKQKRIQIVLVWTMTENIAGACVRSMCIEVNLHHDVQFYRFRTFYAPTHENGSVDANRSMRFR